MDQSYRLWLRWQNNPWRIQTWCRRNCSYRRFLKSYVRAVGTGGPEGPGGPCPPPFFWLSQKQTPFSFKRSSIFLGPPIPPTDFWTFRRPWCLYAWCIMYCKCNVHNFVEKKRSKCYDVFDLTQFISSKVFECYHLFVKMSGLKIFHKTEQVLIKYVVENLLTTFKKVLCSTSTE